MTSRRQWCEDPVSSHISRGVRRHTDEKRTRRHVCLRLLTHCSNAATHVTPAEGVRGRGPLESRIPASRLTVKQLVARCSSIRKKQLLAQLEIDEVPGCQVRGEISSTPPRIGYQAPNTTQSLMSAREGGGHCKAGNSNPPWPITKTV